MFIFRRRYHRHGIVCYAAPKNNTVISNSILGEKTIISNSILDEKTVISNSILGAKTVISNSFLGSENGDTPPPTVEPVHYTALSRNTSAVCILIFNKYFLILRDKTWS